SVRGGAGADGPGPARARRGAREEALGREREPHTIFHFIHGAVLKNDATTAPGDTSASHSARSASDIRSSSVASCCSSWASVRGPTMGAVIPGWSLTHTTA